VIVGTAAIETPGEFRDWADRFGERLAVSLDVRDGRLATRGWAAASGTDLITMARELRSAGAARFIHTSVRRDGTLQGVNLQGLHALTPLDLPILVAGGIASYADIAALRDAGAEGAIIGRALLDGTMDLVETLRVAGSAAGSPEGPSRS
jgi:phosphoribosylformimino-5-aminoimidazole carboxamide ribotide isomerase